jgi:hypothetical protein
MPFIETYDHKSGKTISFEVSDIDLAQIQSAAADCKPVMSHDALKNFIDNLNVSIDVKALLNKLLDHAINLAGTVFNIGRKIMEMLVFFTKKFPNMAMGILIGAVLGAIFSSIPVLGWALGSAVMPILILLGAGVGLWQDLQDKSLKKSIVEATEQTFGNFKNFTAPVQG